MKPLNVALIAASLIFTAGAGENAPANSAPPAASPPAAAIVYTLPDLPYAPEALEPYIDAETMRIHHGKHHAAYVKNLNESLAKHPETAARPLDDLLADLESVPADIRDAVRNNGGGHLNHSLFWKLLSPKAAAAPSGALAQAVERDFGGLEPLKARLTEVAMKRFGSGWSWLTVDSKGSLRVESTPNQDTPVSEGWTPILGIDVWEHAYYLKYQNRRADYVAALFRVLDWSQVSRLYDEAAPKTSPGPKK